MLSEIQTTETKELSPLSDQHQRVMDEYLLCWSKTKAYKAVYKDITHDSARASAARLFADVNFQAHLQQRLDYLHMSAEEAFKLTSDIARGDITQAFDVSSVGFNIDMDKIVKNGYGRLIKKVKQKTTTYLAKKESEEDREVTEVEIELYNAQQAQKDILTMAGKFGSLNSQRDYAAAPQGITASVSTMMQLAHEIEQYAQSERDKARAIDGNTTQPQNDSYTNEKQE